MEKETGYMRMIKYVAGFAMNESLVLLVEKTKPAQLAGRWNGVGGKIEPGERALTAMVREFKEETGVCVTNWTPYCRLLGAYALDGERITEFSVAFYYAHVSPSTMETLSRLVRNDCGERLAVWGLETLPDVLPNVAWLIPMARSFALGERAKNFIVEERYNG